MAAADYAPGFFIKHFIKDMRLAVEESKERDVKLRILQSVLANFEELANAGMEDSGTQRLITLYMPFVNDKK